MVQNLYPVLRQPLSILINKRNPKRSRYLYTSPAFQNHLCTYQTTEISVFAFFFRLRFRNHKSRRSNIRRAGGNRRVVVKSAATAKVWYSYLNIKDIFVSLCLVKKMQKNSAGEHDWGDSVVYIPAFVE